MIAEVFCQRQTGQAERATGARRLVHLAIDQGCLWSCAFEIDNAGFDHLVIEIVTFAGPLAHAGKHRIAAMRLGDVVDEFHDDNGLANAGTAEQANLAALRHRASSRSMTLMPVTSDSASVD